MGLLGKIGGGGGGGGSNSKKYERTPKISNSYSYFFVFFRIFYKSSF